MLALLFLPCVSYSFNFLDGYSFLNDIKEMKGRKQRKVFERGDFTWASLSKQRFAVERIEKGDPEFTKFLKVKERSHGSH